MNMSNTTAGGNGNGSDAPGQRQLTLRHIYLKDVSFESPNTPATLMKPMQPEVKINLTSGHKPLGDSSHEVVVHISVHATVEDESLFLVEVDQAGVFQVTGCTPEEVEIILGTHCPATLFPYIREVVSSLVANGGFPQLLLQPINFEALYAQNLQTRKDA
jgi:preprotein translocase subunit SecB